MFDYIQSYYAVTNFLDQGGVVLYIIFGIAVFLWALIIERFMYIYLFSHRERDRIALKWLSYHAHEDANKIRESYKNSYSQKLFTNFSIIKVLVVIAPLLGLFGTVHGMMEIFDVIAQNGTGDAKAMANGISMATLPTMSGMAVAITGLFFQHKIKEVADRKTVIFNERLKSL